MDFDIARYFEDFNNNRDATMVQKYFAPDFEVEGPDRVRRGRDAWLDLLQVMHTGVREELRPLLTVREGDKMMAEVEAVFTAVTDRADFMFGPLKAGETIRMRFFAAYWLREGQIVRLHLAFWPPGN
ncbi:MAG: nuclear transport factor 2 family protein [Steroidobacteraceae bacterium]